jgi:hypothetical protein
MSITEKELTEEHIAETEERARIARWRRENPTAAAIEDLNGTLDTQCQILADIAKASNSIAFSLEQLANKGENNDDRNRSKNRTRMCNDSRHRSLR